MTKGNQNINTNQNAVLNTAGLEWVSNVYFIGIGGIGMSAIARYFLVQGKQVSGYDKTPSDVTKSLQDLGVNIHFKDDIIAIDPKFLNPNNTVVVYTPAIPKTHSELYYFQTNNFKVYKRSQVLGEITKQSICLAVAGTHGKTTTTSILGHLLKECDVPVTAFLGGISENYNSNLILNGTEVTVVEADEFDRSFLTLAPNLACITSMDADHLDIYGDSEALYQSFIEFSECIKPKGKLFIKNGLPMPGITYGVEDDANYAAVNVEIKGGSYRFNLKTPTAVYKNFQFNLPGRHNLSNATIALAMALEFGCPHNQLAKALVSFKGVKRRFTYQIKTKALVYIDDYAHHPQEITAVYNAVTEMYPNKKVLAVFQPHLYSRTRDFIDEFAESLSRFNEILLLDIYPARELPIAGISSKVLLEKIDNPKKQLVAKSELLKAIKASDANVILTLGAGDIGEMVKEIKEVLSVES